MPKVSNPDKLMEMETLIRWDESEPTATLYTSSPSVRKEWESFGFPVVAGKNSSTEWFATIPKDRISYKPYKTFSK